MFSGHDQTLFDLLAERRAGDPDLLRAVYRDLSASGRSLAAALLAAGYCDRPALLQAIAEYLGGTSLDPLPVAPAADAVALLASPFARTYGVVPLAVDEHSVSLAAVDPFKADLVSDLSFALGRTVRLVVADPEQAQALLLRFYPDGPPVDAAADGPARTEPAEEPPLTEAELARLAGQTPIIHFVNLVLAQAVRDKSSDVHFEPFEHEFKIRYRIDGALHEMTPPPKALALPIVSRLKVLANLNIAERRLPQDGRIKLTLGARAVDLRVSTLPTQFGESVVLRVLDQSAAQLEIRQLGLPPAVRTAVETIIRRPNGIFIVTGPTGSGKTTTLYSCLQAVNSIDAKLLTVEDPVEYELDGVMQVPVNLSAGLTFARALRTFLRQDPDIVMVGEIRDFETAQIAIQASLTGHLVLTTLHTNDAPSAVTRLADMGIEPFLLASTLEGVLAQRLVRRICPACKQAGAPPANVLHEAGLDAPAVRGRAFFSGAGCPACHQSGYQGRLGIFEFLRLTEPLRELVGQGASLLQLRRQAVADGMVTLRAAGLAAAFAGETTLEEVLKYT